MGFGRGPQGFAKTSRKVPCFSGYGGGAGGGWRRHRERRSGSFCARRLGSKRKESGVLASLPPCIWASWAFLWALIWATLERAAQHHRAARITTS
jgi:hypothetical protein